VTASLYGIAISVNFAIGPMLVVILCLLLMYRILGFNEVGYMERELFSCSILYIFIFSLLTCAPFNSTLSKYMTDRICLERFDDIRPCAYAGVIWNLTLSVLLGIPFCLRLIWVGHVPVYYVFTCYMGYVSLCLVLSTMVFNLILKHYRKIAQYYLMGMATTFLLSLLFRFALHFTVTYSMLLALTFGFMVTAVLEFANVLRNFPENSCNYMGPLNYFKEYWQLVLANFFYVFGLFAHNFVFWLQPWRLVVADCYVCNQPYDMASFIAMLTNISGSVFFLTHVETDFRLKYADYMNAVIGGRLDTIEKAKHRMFRTLASQMQTMVYMQFLVSTICFLLLYFLLPELGFSGLTMLIFPMLAVGYFISFLMYSGLLFLYYFNDLTGSVTCGLIFASISLLASFYSAKLSSIWYGGGFLLSAIGTFTYIYFRLAWMERNLDYHIFCTGIILKAAEGRKPPAEVYRRGRRLHRR